MKSLIVTGATGYIGRHVVERAQARGFTVIAASRRQPAFPAVRWIPYQLDGELTPGDFPQDATLIHLAAETRESSAATEALELAAARRILAVARLRGLRVVHVSSQAARADAPTPYGRAKWQVEQEILRQGGFVVRPGLVYGGVPGGVFAGLVDTVRRLPILPAIVPAPRVQPIHVEDLAEGLLRIAERNDRSGRRLQPRRRSSGFLHGIPAVHRRVSAPSQAGVHPGSCGCIGGCPALQRR